MFYKPFVENQRRAFFIYMSFPIGLIGNRKKEDIMVQVEEEIYSVDNQKAYVEDIRLFRNELDRLKNGEISEDDFKRFRLHRGIYGQRTDQKGFNMVRVKIPFGLLTLKQLKSLGEIAREFSDGLAHITTRQDIQFHWVRLEAVPGSHGKII